MSPSEAAGTGTPAGGPAAGEWVRRFHPAPAAPLRLVCLPHAGGSATFWFRLSASLAPDVDVLAVQYPGRQERRLEPPRTDLHDLADEVTRVLLPLLDRPYALLGHSMGALLGYEVARRLRRSGHPAPVALYASGRRAPHIHRPDDVHLRDDAGVVAELRRTGGTDSEVLGDEEMLRLLLPAVRGDYQAVETYRYRPGRALDCPITVLTGDSDPHVLPQEAVAWSVHTVSRHEVRTYPGGHFYLTGRFGEIAALLRGRLRAVPQGDAARTA
ncbi:thioesterase II family protein [Streptomyces sp. NPDC049040]|uniref:thioesterase II family protein n=1 Tax=Streptomyces sp. NPDC049040 TaxID=3365593 RepID=UPI0037204B4B